MRSRQALGGTDGLAEHLGTDVRPERLEGDQVDTVFEDRLEILLKPNELEEPEWAPHLHKEINVALRSGLIASNRPEK